MCISSQQHRNMSPHQPHTSCHRLALTDSCGSCWSGVLCAAAGLGCVVAPGVRNETHDWVVEGQRMRADDVRYVAARVEAFKAGIPPYPAGVFKASVCVLCVGLALRIYPMFAASWGSTTAPGLRTLAVSSWPKVLAAKASTNRLAHHNHCCVSAANASTSRTEHRNYCCV